MAAERAQRAIDAIRAVPSELRTGETWRWCLEETAVRAGVGALVGGASAFLLFRGGRSLARGTTAGLTTGFGAGSAYELCNERFRALQAVSAQTGASLDGPAYPVQ